MDAITASPRRGPCPAEKELSEKCLTLGRESETVTARVQARHRTATECAFFEQPFKWNTRLLPDGTDGWPVVHHSIGEQAVTPSIPNLGLDELQVRHLGKEVLSYKLALSCLTAALLLPA